MADPTPAPAPAPVAEVLPVAWRYRYAKLSHPRWVLIDEPWDDFRGRDDWEHEPLYTLASLHNALADLLPGSTPETVVQDVRRALMRARSDATWAARDCEAAEAERDAARAEERARWEGLVSDLMALHTEPAGFTPAVLSEHGGFASFLTHNQARIEAVLARARAALGEKTS